MSPRHEQLCLNLIAGLIAFAAAWLSTPGEGFARLPDQDQGPRAAAWREAPSTGFPAPPVTHSG